MVLFQHKNSLFCCKDINDIALHALIFGQLEKQYEYVQQQRCFSGGTKPTLFIAVLIADLIPLQGDRACLRSQFCIVSARICQLFYEGTCIYDFFILWEKIQSIQYLNSRNEFCQLEDPL